MKVNILRFLLAIVLVSSSIISYLNSTYYIKNQDWKYSHGFHFGDLFSKSTFEINERAIHSTSGKAKIIFCFGYLLIVKDIETQEKGYYSNKS